MYMLGRFLGYVIALGYLLTILNYFVKWLNRSVMSKRPKEDTMRKVFTRFMRFIVSNHRLFAILTTVALFAHFLIQFQVWGLYPSGALAGSLLLVQGSLGGFGTYIKKKKPGIWLTVHRTLAILLGLAIVLHVLTARFS
ncbi:MAG: hypothetical protein PHQ83_07140 [Eubacteriales bacterium]|nr:hypothetical protein [Eubacteriales bacterium]